MHNFLQPNIYYLQFPKLYIFKIPNFFLKHLVHTCVHMFFKHHCTHMCTHCLKHLVHTGMTCICSLFPRKYDLYLFFMFTQVLLVLLFVSSIWAPHSWKSWRELCPLRKASPNSRSVVSCEKHPLCPCTVFCISFNRFILSGWELTFVFDIPVENILYYLWKIVHDIPCSLERIVDDIPC